MPVSFQRQPSKLDTIPSTEVEKAQPLMDHLDTANVDQPLLVDEVIIAEEDQQENQAVVEDVIQPLKKLQQKAPVDQPKVALILCVSLFGLSLLHFQLK